MRKLNLQPGEIEVFRAGTYPQGTFTEADIDEIVNGYDPVNGHKAYLGVLHRPKGHPEGRAYGVFDALRKVGTSVVAKFAAAVPDAVKQALASGEVTGWSAEVYPDFNGTGKKYLKAVKLTGDVPPQIKGLQANLEFDDGDHGEVIAVEFSEEPAPKRGIARIASAVAAAVTAALGGTHEFDEEDEMPKPNTGAGAPAPDPTIEARFAELSTELERQKEANAKLAAQFAESRKSALEREVDVFCEQALKDGKLSKGDEEAGVRQFAAAIDGITFNVVTKDKDGKDVTTAHDAREFFEAMVDRRIAPVPTGRVSAEATPHVPAGSAKIGTESGDPVDPESVKFEEAVQAHMTANPKATPEQAHAAVSAQFGNRYARRV